MGSEKKSYPLGIIYLNPTDRCNLRCRHCWLSPDTVPSFQAPEGAGTDTHQDLSLSVMKNVIQQARPLGLHTIKLTGGEPFLRADITDLIDLFFREGLSIDIETNGTLIDASIAGKLAQSRVRSISVSLDSTIEKRHDRFRGADGAFSSAVRGIRHLRDNQLHTQIIMSLSRENRDEIEDLACLAAKLGVQSLKINPILPMGRGLKMHQKSRTLRVDELITLGRWVRNDLQVKVPIPIYFCLPTAFSPLSELMHGRPSECAILNILGIVENGDISFCGIQKVEKDLIMGNVHRDRLETLWLHHPLLQHMREAVPWQFEGICGKCFFKKTCLGSCLACTYHLKGSLTEPYWFCREAFEKGLFPDSRYLHG